jgi:predicted AlkP superfamily pyrophosphatase or phosphodiesterase
MLFRRFIILIFIFAGELIQAQDTAYHVIPNRKNDPSQEGKPYLILISIDGFRWDYVQKYEALNILKMGENGVSAEKMLPSYPSKTFPNHYSLITGLYPSHHGIVDNSFYSVEKGKTYQINNRQAVQEASWYQGIPIWVLAEQQKMLTASFFWVGSEAPILGTFPTYYYTYNEKISINDRINQVVNWLKLPDSVRPHLITFYFPEVDHAGHTFGPNSMETGKKVQFVDSALGQMFQKVKALGLPVNFILVSDHGMARVNRENPIELDRKSFDLEGVKVYGGETQLNLYVKNPERIPFIYDSLRKKQNLFKVYLKKDFPKEYHYGTEDDIYGRIGDIILMADYPNVFGIKGRLGPMGTHGFDPKISEMGAIFYAEGPSFKKGIKIAPFENIEVYPILERILKLNPNLKVDGKINKLEKILN